MLKHPESLTQALERALGGAWLPQALQARQASLRQGQKRLRQPLERLTEAYLAAMIPLPEYQRRRPELKKKRFFGNRRGGSQILGCEWGVHPLTSQNLALTTANPKEPKKLQILQEQASQAAVEATRKTEI